jgi:hypothetical protein
VVKFERLAASEFEMSNSKVKFLGTRKAYKTWVSNDVFMAKGGKLSEALEL